MTVTSQTSLDLLRIARQHLAARGYHGTSLAGVAAELGLTKQALLHHFKSKDLLYHAVMGQLKQQLLDLLFEAMEATEQAELQLEGFFVSLCHCAVQDPTVAALLIRVLLEESEPAAIEGALPLQEVLEPLVALVQATAGWQQAGFAAALGLATELLGAVCLLPASQAGLSRRFGPAPIDEGLNQAVAHTGDLVRTRLLR
ncbi:helix-turn-helix domain-containing protein [Pseudophaeobacter sp.]|uniref:TetR/AcrR family transcriptional regulator n=1 Tax=Pseudophaeobacter sp. TaxID=1971739 RepID=UPI00329927D4